MTIVLGLPRSGTTMIAAELERWFDLAIPFETHVIPVFARWQRLYGDLSLPGARRRLLSAVYGFTRLWIMASVSHDRKSIELVSLLVTRSSIDRIIGVSHDFSSLVHAIFKSYADNQNRFHYADKSAYRGTVGHARLREALGLINVIDVVRDGRDQFLSWSKTWFGSSNVVVAAMTWRRAVERAIAASRRSSGDHLMVRYEDYVADPRAERERISAFLHIEAANTGNRSSLGDHVSHAPEHRRVTLGIDPSRIGVYRAEMPNWQLGLYNEIAGDMLRAAGYEVEDVQVSLGDRARIVGAYLFAPIAWGTSFSIDVAKSAIPPILFLYSWVDRR